MTVGRLKKELVMNKMGKADTKFWLKIITTEDIIRRIGYEGLPKFWAYYCKCGAHIQGSIPKSTNTNNTEMPIKSCPKCGAVVDEVSWFN